jgi:uncharacterized protein
VKSLAVVDTVALFAALDVRDALHERAVVAMDRTDLRFVFPAFIVAETAYLAGEWLGAVAQAEFLRGMADADIELSTPTDMQRMAQLIEQYADFPLGAADASVIALAERLDTDLVVTFDERHFRAVKPNHCEHLTLLP